MQCLQSRAMNFCKKLNELKLAPAGYQFSLPTEAQWEFAARAGQGGNLPDGTAFAATVDGERAELARSGGMYMGLALDAGEHVVELEYCTPYLKVGAAVSAASLVLWAVLAAME